MRRSTLLLGVAAAVLIGGATLYAKGSAVERDREHHMVMVRDNALCEKSLEIAASFSSYTNNARMAESLKLTNSWFTESLNVTFRKQAYDLGFTPAEYDLALSNARLQAEANLIPQINAARDPAAKALTIAQACVPWPLDHYSAD
jgi:hypothetical protein